jgi:probable rRNA maturation factor
VGAPGDRAGNGGRCPRRQQQAQRQAEAAGHSLRWDTVWLASHGFLPLLGWDHPDDNQLEAMLAKQGDLLRAIGLAVAD